MPTRWEVTKGVRRSNLPSPARLIMLTLADVAEVGTAEIPAQWTPSLAVLHRETGLSKRTVQRHLDDLEDAGWIKRTRPSKAAQWHGERVRYALLCPLEDMPGVVSEDHHPMDTESTGVVSESRGGGVTESQGYRHSDHPNQISSDQSDHSSSRPTPKQKKSKKERKPEPQRDDVDALCARLADRIADHSERPEITEEWKRQARLLLDADKQPLDKALKLIEWCQDSEFWHTNILSMAKFRKQYEQLRLKANAEWRKSKTGPPGFVAPASNAPRRVADNEKCEEHRRALPCGLCRSEQVGRKSTNAAS